MSGVSDLELTHPDRKTCDRGAECRRLRDSICGKPQNGCDYRHNMPDGSHVTISSNIHKFQCHHESKYSRCRKLGCGFSHVHAVGNSHC